MPYKIVQMTSAHDSHDSRIFHKQCVFLKRAGYDVVLIAPHKGEAVVDGVKIRPVDRHPIRVKRMIKTVLAVVRKALVENGDIYHFHDPELIPAGLLLKALGKKVIYDVHEDLPRQILMKHYLPKGVRGLIGLSTSLLEWLASRCLDGIVAVTPTIAKRFPASKTLLLRNFPIVEEFINSNLVPFSQRPQGAVYSGVLHEKRGLLEMVEAMHLLGDVPSARLYLAGEFSPPEAADKVIHKSGWKKVSFLGWLAHRQLYRVLTEARLGLVPLHPTKNYRESYPVKMFEYLATGLPVVASDFTVWKSLLGTTDCVLWVDPLDPGSIAEKMRWLLCHPEEAQRMGERGRQLVAENYHWEKEFGRLDSFYTALLGSAGGQPSLARNMDE